MYMMTLKAMPECFALFYVFFSFSGDPKGNTMQLIVTGLRLLLAKAVGVNIMMTIKAFLI